MATSPNAITVNGVAAEIRWESFRKGRTDQGPFVTVEFLVTYADADPFIDGVMGGFVSSGGPTPTVNYVPRLKCPTNPTLYATRAEAEYVGEVYPNSGTTADIFRKAKVEVEFGVLTWPQAFEDDPQGDQSFPNEDAPPGPIVFAECEIDYGGEFVTVPNGSLVFTSDQKKLEGAPVGKWVGIDTYRISRHYYPRLPTALVDTYRNQINTGTFLGKSRGRVLFAGAKTRLVAADTGTKCQQFDLTFLVRQYDWNKFIRPDSMVFDAVGDPADNTIQPYAYGDLGKLLT